MDVATLGLSRERHPHPEPWIPRVCRGDRIENDHVIAASADDETILHPAPQRLKPFHAAFTKRFEQTRAIFVKPRWLNIRDNAQFAATHEILFGLKVRVTDFKAAMAGIHFFLNRF